MREWLHVSSSLSQDSSRLSVLLTALLPLVCVAGATLLLATVVEVDATGSKIVLVPFNITMPDVCMTRRCLGLNCPGCGLTRSIVSFLHGRYMASLQFHVLGPVVLFGSWIWAISSLVRGVRARVGIDGDDQPSFLPEESRPAQDHR